MYTYNVYCEFPNGRQKVFQLVADCYWSAKFNAIRYFKIKFEHIKRIV